MVVLTFLTAVAALALIADVLFFGGAIHMLFPDYCATAVSLFGLIIAGIWLGVLKKRKKKKKKRTLALAMVWLNLIACLASTGFWLSRLTEHLLV
ncbi:MAG: hypothetical protein AAGU74_02725 [Bacillota bacterium]